MLLSGSNRGGGGGRRDFNRDSFNRRDEPRDRYRDSSERDFPPRDNYDRRPPDRPSYDSGIFVYTYLVKALLFCLVDSANCILNLSL